MHPVTPTPARTFRVSVKRPPSFGGLLLVLDVSFPTSALEGLDAPTKRRAALGVVIAELDKLGMTADTWALKSIIEVP